MTDVMTNKVPTGKSIKIWGWLTLIAGFLAMASPFISGVWVITIVAILLIFAGVSRFMYAFQGGGFWSGLFGVMAVVTGGVMIAKPLLGLASLTMVLIVYFLAHGVSEVIAAFQFRPEKGWGWLAFSGVISIVLSLMILKQWPLSGAWAIGTLVGIQLVFSGITMITLGGAVKKIGAAIDG